MFIRPCYRRKNGKRLAYWALMESYRTERGPRQRIISYLGQLDESHRLGVKSAAEGNPETRQQLFNDTRHHGLEVDVKRMRVENRHDFGGPWLGLQLVEQLGLKDFFDRTLPDGREKISWSRMALVLPFTVRKVRGTSLVCRFRVISESTDRTDGTRSVPATWITDP